jgi:cobyrinic acid a,c-diamide synthase
LYQVIYQKDNKIELGLSDHLTQDDFIQIIHHLESLCSSHAKINVLLDASDLENYEARIFFDEYDFYKKYKKSLNQVAIVSDRKFESYILDQFNKFSDTEFKSFTPENVEEARKWIFPSKLP